MKELLALPQPKPVILLTLESAPLLKDEGKVARGQLGAKAGSTAYLAHLKWEEKYAKVEVSYYESPLND